MEIMREKEFTLINGRREKVRVTFDIPSSVFKSRSEAIEEFGDIFDESGTNTTEEVIEQVYGAIAKSLVYYFIGAFHCGYNNGEALKILQDSIDISGMNLVEMLKVKRESDKMS